MTQIQEMFQSLGKMQWSDYLDIVLVAFLMYKLIPMFRATGTGRIARVVVVILACSWVTEALQLHTMNFLIDQLLAVGLIAIVILFQPELRRMLDHLSNVKLKKLFGLQKGEQEIPTSRDELSLGSAGKCHPDLSSPRGDSVSGLRAVPGMGRDCPPEFSCRLGHGESDTSERWSDQ